MNRITLRQALGVLARSFFKSILLALLVAAGPALATTKTTHHHTSSHKKSTHYTVNNEVTVDPSLPAAENKASGYLCESKHKCAQMDSCQEAKFYLEHCGLSRLDRDHDGIPCESLCE